MAEELVFTVVGSDALAATRITLEEAGLREREHLQEWVLANPEILGPDVLIITSEFDRWESRGGTERDRLDILGLASDGHLVVAELKRGVAPDTVEMQAIKYAAMASRFDSEVLADAYVEFMRKHHDEGLTNEEAVDRLAAHAEKFGLNDETLRAPRIVLVATDFPANLTSSAVWLSEMGLEITLVRIQAYRTAGEIVVTVSQHYPPPDVEEFLVAPTRTSRRRRLPDLPELIWTPDDFVRLTTEVGSATIRATLDLCAERPGEWIPAEAVREATGREPAQHRGDYGGFTITVHRRFNRSNWPFQAKWEAGGPNQMYYMVDPEMAAMWRAASEHVKPEGSPSVAPATNESSAIHDGPDGKSADVVPSA
jgi:hypothetical protein